MSIDVVLRTASTYVRACTESAKRVELNPTIRISIHQNQPVEDRLREESEAMTNAIRSVVELQQVRSQLRDLIGHKNEEVGVDRLLAERDAINNVETFLTQQIDAILGRGTGALSRRRYSISTVEATQTEHNVGEVQAAIANLKQRLATVTTGGEVPEVIELPSLSKQDVEKLRQQMAAIRRRRNTINDEIASLNLRHSVTLPDSIAEVLRRHQIID